MPTWKRTLFIVWLAQFSSIMGFALGFPFIPFYFKDLGVTEPAELKIWVALFATATPLSLAVFSPIWGRLGDRFGRRMMLIRAQLAAAVIITSMGLVQGPLMLVVLRLLQGMFTGTVTASQSLVTSIVPPQRSGMALGALSASVFSGMTLGAAAGGLIAHHFGYRVPFFAAGVLFTFSALLIIRYVPEPPREVPAARPAHLPAPVGLMRMMFPVLALTAGMAFCRQIEVPFFPLFVEQLLGGSSSAELWTGGLMALGGAAGFFSGIAMGRWSDRIGPARLAFAAVAGAAVLMVPHIFVQSPLWLVPMRFATYFCVGAMDPILQVWLSRVSPPERRGEVFGWSATARSLGWMICPLPAGWLAATHGLRSLYTAGFFLYVLLLPCILIAARATRSSAPPPRG